MKLQSDNKMALVTMESATMLICFNEQEVTVPQEEGEQGSQVKYEYDYCRVSKNAERGEIISAIIRSRYPQDNMESIMNNYLREDKTTEQVTEFNTMQTWRHDAKEVASQVLAALED